MNIKIIKKENCFLVVVEENNTKTEHEVILDENYYKRLTNNKIPREELIKKSFEFLLKKEPKESILKRFNLKIIGSYFPEYEKEILIR